MLQSLKKQSKKKILVKLKIKNFLKYQLWQHLIVFAFVFGSAWFFDKFIEAILFCVAHFVIRFNFDKQYHCGTTGLCLITTLSIIFFGVAYTIPLELSILSTIPVCFVICLAGYLIQDRVDLIEENKIIKETLELSQSKSLEEMTDEEFVQFCLHKHLDDEEIKIAELFIRQKLKGQEFYNAIGYSMAQSKRKRKKILEKLNK